MPVLACHDEVVVECDVEQAVEAKAWLEKAMIQGVEAILNDTDEVDVPVEVKARIVKNWEERG
jgi:DNA polymerase I-like protein with 3'-5' exonuclease and polymerase domains